MTKSELICRIVYWLVGTIVQQLCVGLHTYAGSLWHNNLVDLILVAKTFSQPHLNWLVALPNPRWLILADTLLFKLELRSVSALYEPPPPPTEYLDILVLYQKRHHLVGRVISRPCHRPASRHSFSYLVMDSYPHLTQLQLREWTISCPFLPCLIVYNLLFLVLLSVPTLMLGSMTRSYDVHDESLWMKQQQLWWNR